MWNPFRRQPATVAGPGEVASYEEGRADERERLIRARSAADAPIASPSAADLKVAYDRGRMRERLTRRGSPLLTMLVTLAVIVAGAFIYLAVQNGSFSGGGAVVDQKIDQTERQVNAPIKGAALKAGDALQKAGQSLK